MLEDSRLDERLIFFTADLLEKADRKTDAKALLQRAFDKTLEPCSL